MIRAKSISHWLRWEVQSLQVVWPNREEIHSQQRCWDEWRSSLWLKGPTRRANSKKSRDKTPRSRWWNFEFEKFEDDSNSVSSEEAKPRNPKF
jgi:hypothetical protein